ncbi:hypothetical protein ABPG72_013306 [Tetrahymena utriculariae]
MQKLQFKCDIHPKYDVNLIRFHKDISQVLSCACCIEEQDELAGRASISFQKMTEANQQTYFFNWPPYEKQVSQQLKQQLSNLFTNMNEIKQQKINDVMNFFKELRNQIEKKISSIQQKCINFVQHQQQEENNLLKEYNSISRKLDIQRVIKDDSQSIFQKNQELKKIVDDVFEQKPKNTQMIQKIAKQIVESENQLNLSILERVQNQVLSNLDLFNKQIDNQQNKDYDLQLQISLSSLSQILRNQLNQFSISFIDSFEQAISSNFYLFSEIFQQPIFKKDLITIKYDSLQDYHYTDILKLAQKISQLPYYKSKQIQSYKNTNSLVTNFLNRVSQKQSVQNLLMKYPIFEMIPEIQEIKELKVQLQKSNYNQSSQLFQIYNSDTLYPQVDYTIQQLQAFCDFIINPNLKYIFKIEVSQSANRQNFQFGFGLGSFQEHSFLHCQIVLSENLFEVLDSTENSNVVSINKDITDISKLKDLRFFVNLCSKYKKSDWIRIQSIEIVNQFV